MQPSHLTNYDHEALNFSKLPEYSIECGTDYLAVRDAPRMIKQIQPLSKILDLGCGSGLATRYLKKHFPDTLVIGADINKKMLEQAAAADPLGLYVHIQEIENQINYPFISDTFDVIVSSFVLHENSSLTALELFFSNVAKLLRPNGLFLGWDVYKNLFAGTWKSIKKTSCTDVNIKNGQSYSVKILPANAEVTGTYWSPEILTEIAESFGLKTESHFPVVDASDEMGWVDETKLAPYFVLHAKKYP